MTQHFTHATISEWQWNAFREVFEVEYAQQLGLAVDDFEEEKVWIEQFRNCSSETIGFTGLMEITNFFQIILI